MSRCLVQLEQVLKVKWVCFVEDYKKADMDVTLGKTPVRVRRNESGGFVHHDI